MGYYWQTELNIVSSYAMNNVSLEIKECQSGLSGNRNSKPIIIHSTESIKYNELSPLPEYAIPNENFNKSPPLACSPPSFTSILFSCCSGEWNSRKQRRDMHSPLFTPRSIPPQNIIIDPVSLEPSKLCTNNTY